jgi:protein O-mannosyl-transferase
LNRMLASLLADANRSEEALPWAQRAVELAPTDPLCLMQHGQLLSASGQLELAEKQFRTALRLAPDSARAHLDLASTLARSDRIDEAVATTRAGIATLPGSRELHTLLGDLLLTQNSLAEAEEQLRLAIGLGHDYLKTRLLFGNTLMLRGQMQLARGEFEQALKRQPTNTTALYGLSTVLLALGHVAEAAARLEEWRQIEPESSLCLNNLAWLRATTPDPAFRDGESAMHLARRACELTAMKQPQFLGTLAAAQAEAGRFAEAVETCHKAITLAEAVGNQALAERNRSLLGLYQSRSPYRETVQTQFQDSVTVPR